MSTQSVLLVGAGGHAAACIDVIESSGQLTVAGLIGSQAEVGRSVLGYEVLGTDQELPALVRKYPLALVAVGQIKTPDTRVRLYEQLLSLGYELPVVVSARAYVSRHAKLGAGTIVMHAAIVNARAVLGRNCIINTRALIEHDVAIGDHCHISTAAVINGDVRVGPGSFVGSGALVRQSLDVGERCVIGIGQQVSADCAAGSWVPPRRSPS